MSYITSNKITTQLRTAKLDTGNDVSEKKKVCSRAGNE